MGAQNQNMFLMETQFGSVYRKMVFFIRALWVSFFSSLFTLFRFIRHYFLRLPEKWVLNYEMIKAQKGDKNRKLIIQEDEDAHEESYLRFRFQTFEEFAKINNVPVSVPSMNEQTVCENSVNESTLTESIGDIARNEMNVDETSVVDELNEGQIGVEDVRFRDDEIEMFVDGCYDVETAINDGHDHETSLENEDFVRDEVSDHVHAVQENLEEVDYVEEVREMSDVSTSDERFVKRRPYFLSDDESDSDTDSMVSSNKSSFRSSFMDSPSDGFLSDIDFERAFDVSMGFGWKEGKLSSEDHLTKEDIELQDLSRGYGSDDDLENEDEDIVQELKNIEADIRNESDHILDMEDNVDMESDLVSEISSEIPNSEKLSSNSFEHSLDSNLVDVNEVVDVSEDLILSENVLSSENANAENQLSSSSEDLKQFHLVNVSVTLDAKNVSNVEGALETTQDAENSSSGEQLSSDSDEQNKLEREWEHQDIIEQLKLEIRKVRAIGLPTILEESESPKIMDDLKPLKLKIEKDQQGGTFDELHKFYKSYRERMRKLDILNYQKMYAIGFLKMKDPLQTFTRNKISTRSLAMIVSVDCWPCKPKSSSEIHQPVMKKFTRELENDLEMIYVAQMCLSWEFLGWEYGKALELWESDPHGVCRYNEVAEKFQSFQVLLTRFLEDEQFQGPRVRHYVKTRCVLRNLLQVPVIRDDDYKDRRKERKVVSTKDAITSLQLIEIIEESVRILWKFIRSDKETSNAVLVKCGRKHNVELQNPADAKLLAEVRLALHKKDKKLKESTRSENCVLRNLQRHQEDASDHVLYIFSRVDLKLVTRVLNMSRISTDQLIWCRDKLNNINFVGKQLHVEPSFLLFPCS